jgi:hypothetical protein
MMDDAVSSAAGAERPDVFSEMTAACLTSCGEGGGLGSTVQFSSTLDPEPKMIIYSCLHPEVASRSGQMGAVVNSAPHKKQDG